MSNFDGFEKVEEKLPIYEPCTRKDEDGEKVNKKASDKSWIKAYYLGMREIQVKGDKTSRIHDFQFIECGNMADFNGEEDKVSEGSKISMWGRTTLDDKLVTNAPIGSAVVIKWLGKQKNKTGDRTFHAFELLVHPTLSLMSAEVKSSPKTVAQEDVVSKPAVASAPVSNAAASLDDDDDDDPF